MPDFQSGRCEFKSRLLLHYQTPRLLNEALELIRQLASEPVVRARRSATWGEVEPNETTHDNKHGALAHLGERNHGMIEVRSSSLRRSIT